MNIIEIINKKRLKMCLSDEEIKYVIDEYMEGNIADYQMSSLLMAICINGMSDEEIFSLTKYMTLSGDRLDLSSLGNVVDKHSTGGVGDKTTMIIGPIVASCGVKVAKMSGRGLGHTGGTIDKLESIPGFTSELSEEEFIRQVNNVGFADVCQNNDLAPADKKIYALRDVTGTVESIPLIASSIMSKKIASGARKLVIDVKVGCGALVKNIEDATKLAELMIKIGKFNNIEVVCVLSNMDIPLGNNIGNALEVEEVIDILKNNKQGNLRDLCIELASLMVSLGLGIDHDEALNRVLENLSNGKAYDKFLEFVKAQKGDITKLPKASNKIEIRSDKEGYLNNIDALKLGELSMSLGAGRANMKDKLDYTAGIILNKNIFDYVNIGDVLMTIYTNKDNYNIPDDIFDISNTKNNDIKLIYKVMR